MQRSGQRSPRNVDTTGPRMDPHSAKDGHLRTFSQRREFKDRGRIKARFFSESLFHRKLPDGEKIKRERLLYSPSTGKVFCFYCKLFERTNHSSKFSNEGFDDWKHPELIHVHERSLAHFESIQYCRRWKAKQSLIDTQHQQQIQKEEAYWGKVLSRVVEVVKL